MTTFSRDEVLVQYEYVSKSAKHVSVNHRWAILEDGRYFVSQNPDASVRPADVDSPYYFETEFTRSITS